MSDLVEEVAIAIFRAAFEPGSKTPSPGWSWEKATDQQREFARRQARAAIARLHQLGAARRESNGAAR